MLLSTPTPDVAPQETKLGGLFFDFCPFGWNIYSPWRRALIKASHLSSVYFSRPNITNIHHQTFYCASEKHKDSNQMLIIGPSAFGRKEKKKKNNSQIGIKTFLPKKSASTDSWNCSGNLYNSLLYFHFSIPHGCHFHTQQHSHHRKL